MNLKKQIVVFYQNRKSIIEIINEYGILKADIYNWIKSFNNFGSFKAKNNQSKAMKKNKLIYLQKELKQLRMENDILKQIVLMVVKK